MIINKYPKSRSMYYLAILSLVLVFVFILLGCSVKLIADYDEIIDKSTTELQSKIETFLIKMGRVAGTSEGEYANNTAFYEEIKGVLISMRVRAKVIPKNNLMVGHIDLLEKNFELLRQLHEKQGKKGLTKVLIDPARNALNAQFTAIAELQGALRRGRKK